MQNIIKHNDDFNEWTNILLYKNIISHSLFLKGWCWLCVRDELETGTDCYIDPKFFFNNSSTSFSSWLGCSTVGHWGHKALSLQAGSHTSASCLQLTRTICALVILLSHIHQLPPFFRLFTQMHLLIDGLVEGQSITFYSCLYFVKYTARDLKRCPVDKCMYLLNLSTKCRMWHKVNF